MDKALFSIKGEYVKKIFSSVKKVEYRKNCCNRKIDKMVIYETSPICRIVGEVTVEEVVKDTPHNLWERTKDVSGVEKAFFDSYYSGRDVAYAYVLSNPVLYDRCVSLNEIGIKAAPQSFVYLSEEQYRVLINLL